MIKNKNIYSNQELTRIKGKVLLKANTPITKILTTLYICNKTGKRLRKRKTQRKKASGRKKTLDQSLKLSIRNLIDHNPYLTPGEIVDIFDLNC